MGKQPKQYAKNYVSNEKQFEKQSSDLLASIKDFFEVLTGKNTQLDMELPANVKTK